MAPSTLELAKEDGHHLEHVSVTFSILLGPVLQKGDIADYSKELLAQTLSDLGEYESENKTPLKIEFGPVKFYNEHSGFATVTKDVENNEERHVYVPIFAVPINRGKYKQAFDLEIATTGKAPIMEVNYDCDEVNSTLVHELRHAVDFLDTRLMHTHTSYLSRHQKLRTNVYALMAANIVILNIIAQTADSAEPSSKYSIPIVSLIFLPLLYKYARQDFQNNAYWSDKAYRKDPLEQRAFAHVDLLKSTSEIPRIFGIYKNNSVKNI